MALELEQIQPWDGQSGTGAEVRGALNRNFEKLKDLSILAGMPIKDSFTSTDKLPLPGKYGYNYLVNGHVFSWSTEIDNYIDQGPIKGEKGEKGNSPYIGVNNNWWIDGVDTGKTALGKDGQTPYVGNNGNWWLGNYDTGLKSFNDFLKGYQPEATTAYLNTKYPNPQAGWIAYVPNAASPTGYYIADVNAGVWRITTSPAPAVSASIEDANNRIVSGLSMIKIAQGGNVISELTSTPVTDSNVWLSGHLNVAGNITPSSTWVHSKKFYPIAPGTHLINAKLSGNAVHCIYNGSKQLLVAVTAAESGGQNLSYNVPENARYIKISRERVDNSTLSIAPQNYTSYNYLPEKLSRDFGLGLDVQPSNRIAELTGSILSNKEIWGQGFVSETGAVNYATNWNYSKKWYYVTPGYYQARFEITGNAKVILADRNGVIKQVLSATSIPYSGIVRVTEHLFMRVSHGYAAPASNIYFSLHDAATPTYEPLNFPAISDTHSLSAKATQNMIFESKKLEVPTKKRYPIVTFISDDGSVKNDWFINMLNAKNVKSTFAIIGNRIDVAGSLSANEIISLRNDGHDIAGHTYNHVYLTQLAIADAETEIVKSRFAINQIGVECRTFIAPYGDLNAAVDARVAKYFDTDFYSSDADPANTPPINPLRLVRRSFDNWSGGTGSTIQKCKDFVDGALVSGEWLIFTIHPHYAEYDLPAGQTRRDELSELIDYIKSVGIPILNARMAYEFYKNRIQLREISTVEVLDIYKIGMDGTT